MYNIGIKTYYQNMQSHMSAGRVGEMIFGYARVSTRGQARDGNSLEEQQAKLVASGAEEIFCDVFTGTQIARPEFDKLRQKLRTGDTLIVTKLDRLGRSVSQASELIIELMDAGITINVLNLGILSNDSVNTLLRNVLLAFAQFERDMIVQRTQEGKAMAKTNNPDFKEGRPPKWDSDQIEHALDLLKDHSYSHVTKLTGISKATLYRAKKKMDMTV